jgi:uncharacterized protein YbbC (DUF1343 family)
MRGKKLQFLILFFFSVGFSFAQTIVPAAERTELYFPLLKGKRIGIVANQSSRIGNHHLIDSLLLAGFNIEKVFAPEHGFRGQSEAGASISNNRDKKTNLPIISLYGKHKKPSKEDLQDLDLIIFDIQDVGVRFYTYISTLTYVMEACAEESIPLLLLDRPNPNANYIDGPVLEKKFQSFVGLLPIPVVYGMTLAELAQMINGEGWLKDKMQCEIILIPLANYKHQSGYSLPIPPSPNLPNDCAVSLYPSLCFFEGTPISIGRGTNFPFQVIGYPDAPEKDFSFRPQSIAGKSLHPKFENQVCFGLDLRNLNQTASRPTQLNLNYLIQFYKAFPDKNKFFNSFFNLLAGNSSLQEQIKMGLSEKEIRDSWEKELKQFKIKRTKYLIYPDN